MEKNFLIALLSLHHLMCIGQVFPQGNAEWISIYESYTVCHSAPAYHLWKERLTGDTTIAGHTYQILAYEPMCIKQFKSKVCDGYVEQSFIPEKEIGGIRQEGDKVYFYKFNLPDYLFEDYDFQVSKLKAHVETLLYDFSWSTGDTVTIYKGNGQVARTFKVTSVDTIEGKKHIHMSSISPIGYPDVTVIEGHGESRGIFGMYYYGVPVHNNLISSCFSQDGVLLEDHTLCASCAAVSTHDLLATEPLHLFPNPVADELWIDIGDVSGPFLLRVYNSSGQQMYKVLSYTSGNSIPVRNLGLQGWTFITLTDQNGLMHTGKVFVEGY